MASDSAGINFMSVFLSNDIASSPRAMVQAMTSTVKDYH
jgi:hypothetical protein